MIGGHGSIPSRRVRSIRPPIASPGLSCDRFSLEIASERITDPSVQHIKGEETCGGKDVATSMVVAQFFSDLKAMTENGCCEPGSYEDFQSEESVSHSINARILEDVRCRARASMLKQIQEDTKLGDLCCDVTLNF